ncbi:DUF1958 domain-containing protein, partial [Streptococcus plurextorum]|uniref:DUF1958 domain-containing protein n=1 Tax=Streptococcus plurextorum TaxID=456876 RepID=UPI000417B943
MKKLLAFLVTVSCLVSSMMVKAEDIMDITRAAGYEVYDINRPKSSIVIDGKTGAILWQDNIDAVRDPASMSKMMTLYLVYEAIAEGKLTEDTVIRATASDQAIAGIYAISNNKIVAGVDYTVSELITMTAVPSSNVTTVMLANHLSDGDPDAFLDLMNAKAQELGMTNTKWFNASGAVAVAFGGYYTPKRYDNEATNQTTARDMSILAYHFVKNYPGILEHTRYPQITVKAGTPYEETFETYNYSLPGTTYGIEGVTGLKTGSSPSAAFNYMATVDRGGQQVIAVVMGVGDWSDPNGEYYRHPFGNALIEKAYAEYDYRLLLKAGQEKIDGVSYELSQDFYGTVKKGDSPSYQVEAEQLTVNNGLESVSPQITASQTVLKVENPVVATVKSLLPKDSKTGEYHLGILLIPLGLILLAIILYEVKGRKK